MRCEAVQESLCAGRNLLDGRLEGHFVCLGGRAIARNLADELKGNQGDIILSGWLRSVPKRPDVTAHRQPQGKIAAHGLEPGCPAEAGNGAGTLRLSSGRDKRPRRATRRVSQRSCHRPPRSRRGCSSRASARCCGQREDSRGSWRSAEVTRAAEFDTAVYSIGVG